MALEDLTGSGKFLGSLVPTNPVATDDRREGDDHIRGVKNVLKNTFPNVNAACTLTAAQLNAAAQKTGDTFSGVVLFASGTGSLPGMAFSAAPGTGLYRPSFGGVNLVADGATRVRVTPAPHVAVTLTTAVPAASGLSNDELVFSRVSDTSVRVSLKGQDGVVRTTTLTLA